jgi:hypothetical protein
MSELKLTALNERAKAESKQKNSKTQLCAAGCDWGCANKNGHR